MMTKQPKFTRRSTSQTCRSPVLRFSPTAWAKLLFLRDYGPTEVGGFGISSPDDLLYVEDVQLIEQSCTSVSVVFDDAAVADFFDAQVDAGRRPAQFARLWLHTHPGDCPRPSLTDESTFARVFGNADWAVMFIIAAHGPIYARLRFNIGPGCETELPVAVDYSRPFAESDFEAWQDEYCTNVRAVRSVLEDIPAEFLKPAEPRIRELRDDDTFWSETFDF